MPALPLRPVPVPRETVFSFLSRFAAVNAATATDFSVDLGFGMKRFVQFEQAALDRLCETAALDRQALDNLKSWTGTPVGDAWMEFRKERFPSKAVRSPVMRGCPICLREDAKANPNDPVSEMVMRGDWLLRDVAICSHHEHELVPLWQEGKPEKRFDGVAHLRDLASRIIAGELDQPRRAPSPYDLWLDARLTTGEDPTWLADHGLFVATTMCNLLGELLVRDNVAEAQSPTDLQARAQAAGFEVLSKGEPALRAAFKALAASATSKWVSLRGTYGRLYDGLVDYLKDDGFEPFRSILRECILETWPFAAGDVVLGETLSTRLLHTPASAAIEIGIDKKLVEMCLIDVGAVPENDPRPPALQAFSAPEYDSFLKEIPSLVGAPEMRDAIGATAIQLQALSDAGILRPFIRHPKVRSPWRVSDGLDLLAELDALAVPLSPPSTSWEQLQLASRRSGLNVGNLVAAIRSEQLQLGRDTGLEGYRSYMVLKDQVDQLTGQQPRRRQRDESLPAGELASDYAVKLGISLKAWFQKLFTAGHVSARWVPHPTNGTEVLYLTNDDIAAFHARFMTPMTMQAEFGVSWQKCMVELRKAGVTPFTPDDQEFGPLYERRYVEPILRFSED